MAKWSEGLFSILMCAVWCFALQYTEIRRPLPGVFSRRGLKGRCRRVK